MPAPYRRGYHHTGAKGRESSVICSYCGKTVPRWKTFVKYSGFRINDPVLRKQLDPRQMSMFSRKMYVCPSCARFRGIVRIGRSRKSRAMRTR
jgi:small subunit ribosomal protein S26e